MNKKTKKYFIKYTLEFFVIFLGISLSFMINSWNEAKKDEILEIKYLKSLKEEYISNLKGFDESYSYHKPRWIIWKNSTNFQLKIASRKWIQ